MSTIRANGLQFGNIPVNDATTLDWYEEGTWTPTVFGSSVAGTPTYGGGNGGSFTRIGRVITFNAYVTITNITGATGNLIIGGAPWFSSMTTDYGHIPVMVENISFTSGGNWMTAYFRKASNGFELWSMASNTAWTIQNVTTDTSWDLFMAGSMQIV